MGAPDWSKMYIFPIKNRDVIPAIAMLDYQRAISGFKYGVPFWVSNRFVGNMGWIGHGEGTPLLVFRAGLEKPNKKWNVVKWRQGLKEKSHG